MRAKKSLGQHFLTSRTVVRDIVSASRLNKEDVVLEIGPGKGMLTETLLENSKKVIAIERDKELVVLLKEKFSREVADKKLELIEGDILTIDIDTLGVQSGEFKVVANIPYYITGMILKKILSSDTGPKLMTLLIQNEVARRIAKEKKESILSISVKAYGAPQYIKKVPARYFKPKPKVDSAILLIDNISKDFFKNISEETFFTLLKSGFAHKRKFLIKNVEQLFDADIENVFKKCNVSPKSRAENLSLDQWALLSKQLV